MSYFTRIFLMCQVFLFCKVYSFRFDMKTNPFRFPGLKSSSAQASSEDFATRSTLWTQNVQFVDLNNVPSESSKKRELPLFILDNPFFPAGITFLHIFEMKYRTMMFDIAQKDDCFGYIYGDRGQIAQVGTLSKITRRELQEDGRQNLEVSGVERFRVLSILKTLPYILAEVEPIEDELPVNQSEAIELESALYNLIKFYVRILKSVYGDKYSIFSPEMKLNRPTPETLLDHNRRTRFSLSVGNMLLMRATDKQLMLQTTDIVQRLTALKEVYTNVVDFTTQSLIDDDALSASTRDEIRMRTYNSDFDEDILPPDVVEADEEENKDEWDINNIM